MALSTTMKLTEQIPFRNSHSHSPSSFFFCSKPSFYPLLKPFSSLRSSSTTTTTTTTTTTAAADDTNKTDDNSNPTTSQSKPTSNSTSSPWLNKWAPSSSTSPSQKLISNSNSNSKRLVSKQQPRPQPEGPTRTTAIERIVLRLRDLGLGSDDEDEQDDGELNVGSKNSSMPLTGDEKLGDLLARDWVRPDMILSEKKEDDATVLPWEREREREEMEVEEMKKKKEVKAPTLAELTMEDVELRRLRTQGMTVRERISVPKAGLTKAVLEKIHDQWRKSELVRLKFHEDLARDMRTAHKIVERRTGGLVIWRSGSVMMVYRGTDYAGPSSRSESIEREEDSLFVPDVTAAKKSITRKEDTENLALEISKPVISDPAENMSDERAEFNSLLDSLGPRFEEWWGTGILPVDADLLPQTIPGYKTPLRLLPTGMRPRLTNAEMTNLRKIAKSLPIHFALGRNRNHQGLAAAIIKLWETTLIVKIAVKRGIQNTNNLLMADELKKLTGGVLLLRNKYYIVMYRGKDFVPSNVAVALAEREEVTKQIQDVEEKVRTEALKGALVRREEFMKPIEVAEEKVEMETIETNSTGEQGYALAGTLAEFYQAQAQWGREISSEEHEKMMEAASQNKISRVVKRLEHKLYIAQGKCSKAEKELAKIRESWLPVGPPDDQETVTDEERVMFRRVGLRMKPYLPLGIRGVFDGVIENMHLHWKHRELVKLISKQKDIAFVEETARLLEFESGGILIDIVRVPKGYAILYYRGKNYRRPISLRPRNLPTKARALKRWMALQRYEALSQHVTELERGIEQIKNGNGDSEVTKDKSTSNNHASQSTQSEDEDSWMDSDVEGDEGDEDFDSGDEDEDSEISSLEDNDY